MYADSIWRGGDDHSFAGVGPERERWITYRDMDVYDHVVTAGSLFPLNSLMLHGLIYAQHAPGLDSDPGHDFPAEVHSYFGSGTSRPYFKVDEQFAATARAAERRAGRWKTP